MTKKKSESKPRSEPKTKPEPEAPKPEVFIDTGVETKPLLPALAQALEVIASAAQSTSDSERSDADKIAHFASYLREFSFRLDRDARGL